MTTVQDVFNQFYSRYERSYTSSMQQAKARVDIMRCRTAALGVAMFLSAKSAAILLCAIIHAGIGAAPCDRVLPKLFGWTKGEKIYSMLHTSMWYSQRRKSFTH